MVTSSHLAGRTVPVFMLLFLTLVLLTISVAGTFPFVIGGDSWFEHLLFGVRTAPFLNLFNWITLLGNTFVVSGITGAILIALFSSTSRRTYAYGLAVTVAGAALTSYLMKILVARARPDGLIPSMTETSFSFPSGHATAAMALYGFMAYLLCALSPAKKRLVLSAAMIIVASVGFSRLYLGVHFPSDVLAGYLIGGLWIILGSALVAKLRLKEKEEIRNASLRY